MKTKASAPSEETADLQLAFDVGHSSIGWAVLKTTSDQIPPVNLVGCGVVTFPKDDCLASERRRKRQMRRHVRATRKRIDLMARLLVLAKAMTPEGMKEKLKQGGGNTAPWLLSARLLASNGKREHLLEWPELFDVLRWYAHNRGYDAQPPWITGFNLGSGPRVTSVEGKDGPQGHEDDASDDDSEDAKTARKLKEGMARMAEAPATETMAETVCKILYDGLFPTKEGRTLDQLRAILFDPAQSEMFHKLTRYKGESAVAFPRQTVMSEVRRLLEYHRDAKKLAGCDDVFITAIMDDWTALPDKWKAKQGDGDKTKVWMPRRFGFERDVRDSNNQLIRKERHYAGLLFGQAIPRFHNRIVSTCPITYSRVLRKELNAGQSFPAAEEKAHIQAKVPVKKSKEFLLYRWAVGFLAGIKVGESKAELDHPLSLATRTALNARMQDQGYLSRKELEELVASHSGFEFNNVSDIFELTPEAEDALCVDPVRRYLAKDELVQAIWPAVRPLHARIAGQLRRGKRIKLAAIRSWLNEPRYQSSPPNPDPRNLTEQFDEAVNTYIAELKLKTMREAKEKGRKRSEKTAVPDAKNLLHRSLAVTYPSARAPYHRDVLKKAVEEVLAGLDPRKKKRTRNMPRDQWEKAEEKEADGVLVETEDMMRLRLGLQLTGVTEEQAYEAWKQRWLKKRNKEGVLRNRQIYADQGDAYSRKVWQESRSQRWLAEQTNNHLVRHRLLILQRLVQDIIKAPEFCHGHPERVCGVAIEVARDLVTFSGMSSEDKGTALKSLSNQHRDVEAYLKKMLAGREYLINGSLIWKAKVADDLKWKCPYTRAPITPDALVRGDMDIDHIIPKSVKLTNAMEAVVITFKQVNRMKGARTAWEFVEQCERETVPETGEKIRNLRGHDSYESFVDSLKEWGVESQSQTKFWPQYLEGKAQGKTHPDYRRRRFRKKLLRLKTTPKKKDGFTSRDLTITSYLNRLTQHSLRKLLTHLGPENFVSIPGIVTAAMRDARSWQLLGCLGDKQVIGEDVMRAVPKLDPETREPIKDPKTGKTVTKLIPKPKSAIRGITHLHHAVDACALGLIAHFLPKNGRLWEYVALGELTEEEKENYESLRDQFKRGRLANGEAVRPVDLNQILCLSKLTARDKRRYPDPDRVWRLVPAADSQARNRMEAIRQQIKAQLAAAKRRVIQHVPSDRTGLATKETVWRVANLTNREELLKILRRMFAWRDEKNPETAADEFLERMKGKKLKPGEVWLVRYIRRDTTPQPSEPSKLVAKSEKFFIAYDIVPEDGLIGVAPEGDTTKAKLLAQKGAKALENNFAIAVLKNLKDEAGNLKKAKERLFVVRWRKVHARLRELRDLNGGEPVDLIRPGTPMHIEKQPRAVKDKNYRGLWRVVSVKDNAAAIQIDMIRPEYVKAGNGLAYAGMNKNVSVFVDCGLTVYQGKTKPPLTGIPVSQIPESQISD